MKLVVATRNRHKLKEIQALFGNLPVQLIDLADFPDLGPVEENGSTLQENALLKARAAQRALGLPAIADDTGLEVDALDGAPGIRSARFSGPRATYSRNVDLLLEKLAGVPEGQRTGRFRTCAVYVDDRQELIAEGAMAGRITFEPRGDNGFGYDPVFLPDGQEQTFAEMPAELKDRISHRARAFGALRDALERNIFPITKEEAPAQTH